VQQQMRGEIARRPPRDPRRIEQRAAQRALQLEEVFSIHGRR
jgi:hypothetical protein